MTLYLYSKLVWAYFLASLHVDPYHASINTSMELILPSLAYNFHAHVIQIWHVHS